jgi:hypothetical protein
MKKKELFAVSFLSVLVLVSFANVSVAAPPSYVGIKTGDEFIWTASFNIVNLNATGVALFGADNWTLMYEYFLEFMQNGTGMETPLIAGAGMKFVMQNVSDEIPHPYTPGLYGSGVYFDQYVAYELDNWTLVSEAANYSNPMIYIVDPSLLNETNIMSAMMGMPIFLPIGFPFNTFITYWSSMIAANPYLNGNVTVQVQGNGFRVTLNPTYLAWVYSNMGSPFEIGTLSSAVLTARWNSNGVFDYGTLEYGGLTMATAQLVTSEDDLIPGFEVVTLIGVSLVSIIALVYIQRKKKLFN